jgi:hypothetical protein
MGLVGLLRTLPRAFWRRWIWAANLADKWHFQLRVPRLRARFLSLVLKLLMVQHAPTVVFNIPRARGHVLPPILLRDYPRIGGHQRPLSAWGWPKPRT